MSKRPFKNFEVRYLFESSTGCLNDVRGIFSALSGDNCLTRCEARRCRLALVEAVTNAIIHAHKCDAGKEIGVRIRIVKSGIVMEVKDCGGGFELKKVPRPELDQIGGRGLFIIKKLMKKVEYKDNILRMTYER